MNEQAEAEKEVVAATPRLIFNAPVDSEPETQETDVSNSEAEAKSKMRIPHFLRKGSKTDPKKDDKEITEPDAPIEVQEPAADKAPIEDAGTADTPAIGDEPEENDLPEDQETVLTASSSKDQDLDDMTVEDLKRQQEEINRKIREKQEAEKRAMIQQIVNVVNTYNIPVEEIVDALGGLKIKRKGVKAKVKYRDPETGVTWSGRGKEPLWIKDKDREPFLVENQDDYTEDEDSEDNEKD